MGLVRRKACRPRNLIKQADNLLAITMTARGFILARAHGTVLRGLFWGTRRVICWCW
jgi:hypothetical protein